MQSNFVPLLSKDSSFHSQNRSEHVPICIQRPNLFFSGVKRNSLNILYEKSCNQLLVQLLTCKGNGLLFSSFCDRCSKRQMQQFHLSTRSIGFMLSSWRSMNDKFSVSSAWSWPERELIVRPILGFRRDQDINCQTRINIPRRSLYFRWLHTCGEILWVTRLLGAVGLFQLASNIVFHFDWRVVVRSTDL